MSFLREWRGFDSLLVGGDSSRKILSLRIENAQLQIGVAEMGIEFDRSFQLRFNRIDFFLVPILLGECDGVEVMRHGTLGMKVDESLHPVCPSGRLDVFGRLQPAEKKVWRWIRGFQIASLKEELLSLLFGALREPGRAQS